MQLKNSQIRYGAIAMLLHWLMAGLIIGLLAVGLYMVPLAISLQKLKLYGWHKGYGVLVLLLVTIRLAWRFSNIRPPLDLPWFEKFAASAVHWAFYGFMLAMPITGWLMSSAAGLSVSFFGWFVLPDLVSPNQDLMQWLQIIHRYLSYALIAAIFMHTSAALKHHFITKDDILRRMLP